MSSDRTQRRIQRLLDQIDAAEAAGDWSAVKTLALDLLDAYKDNAEAAA